MPTRWVPIQKPPVAEAPVAPAPATKWVPITKSTAEPVLETAPTPATHWVPIPEWKPTGRVSKDLVEFDDQGKAIYISKETGEAAPVSRGFYPTGDEGPHATPAPPVVAQSQAAPASVAAPARPAPLPSKSGLDSAVGTVAKGAFQYGKGLLAPFTGAVKGLANMADPLVALVHAELGGPSLESLKGTPHEAKDPFYELYSALANTALSNPTDLLGGSAQRLRTQGTDALRDPSWWGEATSDTVGNLTLVPGALRILGTAKRAALPAKTNAAVDTAIGRVIPKYNWPDAMLGAEGANVGTKMAKGAEMHAALESIKDMPNLGPATPQQAVLHQNLVNKMFQDSTDLVNAGAASAEELSNKIKAIAQNPKYDTIQKKLGNVMDLQLSLATNHKLLDEMTNMAARDGRPIMFSHPPTAQTSPFSTTAPRPSHIPADYVQVGEHADLLGAYRGSYVHPDVADVLPTLQRTPEVANWLTKYTMMWKKAKTLYSPNTHINNIFGNVLFAHLAGNNPFNPLNVPYYRQATREISDFTKNGNISITLREAMEDGAVRPGFANIELRMAEDRIANPKRNIASELYEGEDLMARYATYLKNRQAMPRREAGIETNKYFPGYSSTSEAGRKIRSSAWGGVFTSFPMESARIYATAGREQPWRVAGAGAMLQSLVISNLTSMDMTLEDWYEMKRRMPSHMRHRTLIPFEGDNGIEIVDWTNFIPLAEVLHQGDNLASSGAGRSLLFGGPAWNAFKLVQNHDWFSGQPVIDTDKGEGMPERILETGKGLLPVPNFPFSLKQRYESSKEELPPRRGAEPESMDKAIWYSLFPSMDTRSEEELRLQGALQEKAEINDLKKGHRSLWGNPTLPQATKERRSENIIDQLRRRSR